MLFQYSVGKCRGSVVTLIASIIPILLYKLIIAITIISVYLALYSMQQRHLSYETTTDM